MTLARELGPLDAMTLVVGGVIGSGIFLAPSIVAREVGAPGLSLASWVVGGALALCGALCYAELGAAIPETGGTYPFLRRAYRPPVIGFLYAWTFFFATSTGAIAAIAAAFATYTGMLISRIVPVSPFALRALGAAAIALVTGINILGARSGGRVQTVVTVLKIGAIAAIVGIGFTWGAGGVNHFQPFAPPGHHPVAVVSAFGTSLIPVLFAYSGWPMASYVAGEIRDPRRNVPLATVGGLVAVVVVYLVVNAAFMYVLPFPMLRQSTLVASDAMQAAIGTRGAIVVALAVVLSTVGALNAAILGYPRIGFALASDGLLPAAIARVHPRHRTPINALIIQGVVASLFVLSGSFERILGYFAFVDYFFFALAVGGIIVLRVREPAMSRPYRAWGYPLTPIMFLLISTAYLSDILITRFGDSIVGIGIMLAGLPFYFWYAR